MESFDISRTWGYPPAIELRVVGSHSIFSKMKGAFIDDFQTRFHVHFNGKLPNSTYFVSLRDCHIFYIHFVELDLKFRIFSVSNSDQIIIISDDYMLFKPFITAFIRKKKISTVLE
jgi:hypothetical protein